jgi:hypothetical protein
MMPVRLAKRGPRFIDVFRQQPQLPFRRSDGEEEAASGNEVATVLVMRACSRGEVMGIPFRSTHPTGYLPCVPE